MDYFEELCRWTDCRVTVLAEGRAAVLTPLDDSEKAWILFQEIVEEIRDELAGDSNFEVQPHAQHRRELPGQQSRPVYDQITVTKVS
jgi:virulence-associated protein VagC